MQIKSINTEPVRAIVEEDVLNGAQDTYRFSTLICACGNIICDLSFLRSGVCAIKHSDTPLQDILYRICIRG